MTGKVKWYDSVKGYGFLESEQPGAPDLFLHHTGLRSKLIGLPQIGDEVSYDRVEGERGPKAINVIIRKRALTQ